MTMTMSRPSPVPDAPASFESRERAALAAAIERHRQLLSHLNDVRERARSGMEAALASAYENRATAETALREAAGSASEQALARVLGGAGPTITELEDALTAARKRFDDAHRDRELVADEIGRLSRAVDSARDAVQQAVAAVLAASPGWAALLAELSSARARVMVLENTIADLHKLPAVHLPQDWSTPAIRTRPEHYLPDPALATQWRDAITALTADASAVLPGD
jgi:outer membrane PBP1 activator LpoA protein